MMVDENKFQKFWTDGDIDPRFENMKEDPQENEGREYLWKGYFKALRGIAEIMDKDGFYVDKNGRKWNDITEYIQHRNINVYLQGFASENTEITNNHKD